MAGRGAASLRKSRTAVGTGDAGIGKPPCREGPHRRPASVVVGGWDDGGDGGCHRRRLVRPRGSGTQTGGRFNSGASRKRRGASAVHIQAAGRKANRSSRTTSGNAADCAGGASCAAETGSVPCPGAAQRAGTVARPLRAGVSAESGPGGTGPDRTSEAGRT